MLAPSESRKRQNRYVRKNSRSNSNPPCGPEKHRAWEHNEAPNAMKTGADLSQMVPANPLPFRRTIRRPELRQIVPLADTTIYEMERRGEFPRRFNLTPRCVVWDLTEVECWVEARRQAAHAGHLERAPTPDVRRRKRRPVKAARVS